MSCSKHHFVYPDWLTLLSNIEKIKNNEFEFKFTDKYIIDIINNFAVPKKESTPMTKEAYSNIELKNKINLLQKYEDIYKNISTSFEKFKSELEKIEYSNFTTGIENIIQNKNSLNKMIEDIDKVIERINETKYLYFPEFLDFINDVLKVHENIKNYMTKMVEQFNYLPDTVSGIFEFDYAKIKKDLDTHVFLHSKYLNKDPTIKEDWIRKNNIEIIKKIKDSDNFIKNMISDENNTRKNTLKGKKELTQDEKIELDKLELIHKIYMSCSKHLLIYSDWLTLLSNIEKIRNNEFEFTFTDKYTKDIITRRIVFDEDTLISRLNEYRDIRDEIGTNFFEFEYKLDNNLYNDLSKRIKDINSLNKIIGDIDKVINKFKDGKKSYEPRPDDDDDRYNDKKYRNNYIYDDRYNHKIIVKLKHYEKMKKSIVELFNNLPNNVSDIIKEMHKELKERLNSYASTYSNMYTKKTSKIKKNTLKKNDKDTLKNDKDKLKKNMKILIQDIKSLKEFIKSMRSVNKKDTDTFELKHQFVYDDYIELLSNTREIRKKISKFTFTDEYIKGIIKEYIVPVPKEESTQITQNKYLKYKAKYLSLKKNKL